MKKLASENRYRLASQVYPVSLETDCYMATALGRLVTDQLLPPEAGSPKRT